MSYDYVVTLEDDLIPSQDFLLYHQDMARVAADNHDVLAVLAYPNGPWHDCHAIADKLLQRGVCRTEDHTALYKSSFFAGWGAGIPARAFAEYLPAWNYSGIYDGILNALVAGSFYTLAPCRPRVRLIANQGIHGQSEVRWDAVWRVDEDAVQGFAAYKVIQGGELEENIRLEKGGACAVMGTRLHHEDATTTCTGDRHPYFGVRRMSQVLGETQPSGTDTEHVVYPAHGALALAREELCSFSSKVKRLPHHTVRHDTESRIISNYNGQSDSHSHAPESQHNRPSHTSHATSLNTQGSMVYVGAKHEYVIWSSDFHTGPIASLKKVAQIHLLEGLHA
jgi:hypothetical protein